MSGGFEMEENQTPKKRNYERYLDGESWSPSTGHEQENSLYYIPEENRENASYASVAPSTPSSASGAAYQGLEEPVSMGEWALCIFLNCIPCVGLIMMFVWAFGKTEKKSKSNFFKVQLIFMGVILALYLVLFLFALGMGLAFA